MKAEFFAYYRDPEYAGCKEADFPAVATLRDFGNLIGERYGEKFRSEFFTDDGTGINEKTIILVNGRRSDFLNGLDTELSDSDVIKVFPVVAGG